MYTYFINYNTNYENVSNLLTEFKIIKISNNRLKSLVKFMEPFTKSLLILVVVVVVVIVVVVNIIYIYTMYILLLSFRPGFGL